MNVERVEALLVAAHCARLGSEAITALDVGEVLSDIGVEIDPGKLSDLSAILHAYASSYLIGLAEVFDDLAKLDDARWSVVREKTKNADNLSPG